MIVTFWNGDFRQVFEVMYFKQSILMDDWSTFMASLFILFYGSLKACAFSEHIRHFKKSCQPSTFYRSLICLTLKKYKSVHCCIFRRSLISDCNCLLTLHWPACRYLSFAEIKCFAYNVVMFFKLSTVLAQRHNNCILKTTWKKTVLVQNVLFSNSYLGLLTLIYPLRHAAQVTLYTLFFFFLRTSKIELWLRCS